MSQQTVARRRVRMEFPRPVTRPPQTGILFWRCPGCGALSRYANDGPAFQHQGAYAGAPVTCVDTPELWSGIPVEVDVPSEAG